MRLRPTLGAAAPAPTPLVTPGSAALWIVVGAASCAGLWVMGKEIGKVLRGEA